MKIAVTYENGQVFQHFGHCEQFKLYDATDGAVTSSQVVSAVGSGTAPWRASSRATEWTP